MSAMSRLQYDENNPILIPPTSKCNRTTRLYVTSYACNHQMAVVGLDQTLDIQRTAFSLNIPDNPPAPGCAWILGEENLDTLARANVIEFTGKFDRTAQGVVYECEVYA